MKLGRAEKHVEEFLDYERAYWANESPRIARETIQNSFELAVEFGIKFDQQPGKALAATGGDVLVNLRAALDYTAKLLLDSRKGNFPICDTEDAFTKWTARTGLASSSETVALLRHFQPFALPSSRKPLRSYRPDGLSLLRDAANNDKHASLARLGFGVGSASIEHWHVESLPYSPAYANMHVFEPQPGVFQGDWFPLVRVDLHAWAKPHLVPTPRIKYALQLAFGDLPEAGPQLWALTCFVITTVAQCRAFAVHNWRPDPDGWIAVPIPSYGSQGFEWPQNDPATRFESPDDLVAARQFFR